MLKTAYPPLYIDGFRALYYNKPEESWSGTSFALIQPDINGQADRHQQTSK